MVEGGKADHSCELASPRCVTNLRVAELNLKFGADAAQKKKKKTPEKQTQKNRSAVKCKAALTHRSFGRIRREDLESANGSVNIVTMRNE